MEIDGGAAAPIEADWRVRMFAGAPQVIDISVGGVSIVAHQREEVGDWISEIGVSGFIAHMRQVADGGGA